MIRLIVYLNVEFSKNLIYINNALMYVLLSIDASHYVNL